MATVYATPTTTLSLMGTPGVSSTDITRYLKVLVHSSAAGADVTNVIVFTAPSGSDIIGDKIGEYEGIKAFEVALESGEAVFKLDTRNFGGEYLDTSQTPVCLLQGTSYTTGIIPTTIIIE